MSVPYALKGGTQIEKVDAWAFTLRDVTNRRHWISIFRGKSDEELRAFHSEAEHGERRADQAWARAVHRKRRIAAEREIARRGGAS